MRKPVKKVAVIFCLLLIACIVATLFVPVFSINLAPHATTSEYTNVTGLEMIRALFGDGSKYLTETTGVQAMYDFLGKGVADLGQYINPIFANIMLYTYIGCLGLAVIMLIFTIINMAGHRLSVFNVFTGLFTMLGGIMLCLCIPLQNAEYVSNAVIYYNLRVSIGAIALIVVGFAYMMFAPKKRV